MPVCMNCDSTRLGITEEREQRVYCHDCGSYAEEVLPGHVLLAEAKESTEAAFSAWGRLVQISKVVVPASAHYVDDPEYEKRSVDTFLAQAEVDIGRLHAALSACKAVRCALAELNGEVTRDVWTRLYPVTKQLDAVLASIGDAQLFGRSE